MNKALKVWNAIRAKEKINLKNQAFSSAYKPITAKKLEALKVNGVLTLEAFKANIGSIFPVILSLVSEGHSMRSIERLMGFKPRSLEQFILRISALHKAVQAARDIKSDRQSLTDLLT